MASSTTQTVLKGARDFTLFVLGVGVIVHEVVIVDGDAEWAILLTGMSLLGLIAPLRLMDTLRGISGQSRPSPPQDPPQTPAEPVKPVWWNDQAGDGWAP